MRAAYEVRNPSFSDMNIEQQIEAGINDWCAEDEAGREFFGQSRDEAGREFFGQSRDEAERARLLYQSHKTPRGYIRIAGQLVCNHG